MTDLYAWYHCWVDGDWFEPVTEYLEALDRAQIPFRRKFLGLVGTKNRRDEAAAWFPGWELAAEQDTGHEEVTLRALHAFSKSHDGYAIYGHDKAAWHRGPDDIHVLWRRRIVTYTVFRWRDCVRALADHDVCGPHWLTPEKWPGDPNVPVPIMAGNFWWADLAFLRTLPELPAGCAHHDPERWLGVGDPAVYCQDDRFPDASAAL